MRCDQTSPDLRECILNLAAKTEHNHIDLGLPDDLSRLNDEIAQVLTLNAGLRDPFLEKIQRNYFSICLEFAERRADKKRTRVFCKIPKGDPGQLVYEHADAIGDRLAENEAYSLFTLGKYWPESRVRFSRLIAYRPTIRALFYEYIDGGEYFRRMRTHDLAARVVRTGNVSRAMDLFSDLGESLAVFHAHAPLGQTRAVTPLHVKVKRYADTFRDRPKLFDLVNHAADKLQSSEADSHEYVATLKGLDIRNVNMAPTGDLCLFDPGAVKPDLAEADLARFVVTLRILYWGNHLFVFNVEPVGDWERRFLDGYRSKRAFSESRFQQFALKELIRHWTMAYVALNLKNYSPSKRRWMRSVYIDRVYEKKIQRELAKWK